MRIADEDAYVQSFATLAEVNMPLAMRILLVRQIMEQRGLDSKDIQELTGYGKRWVLQALAFNYIRLVNDDTSDKRMSWEAAHARLDVIEDAITQWTRANGGVYSVSGATKEYVDDFQSLMSSSRALKIQGQEEV